MSSTRTLALSAITLLGSTLLSHNTQAQTAPAWAMADVLAIGITQNIGACVVDAAGNRYQVGSFFNSLTLGNTTLTSQGVADGFLAKYTPAGTLAWVQQFGSVGNDIPRDMALDAAGNVYVTGNFGGTMNLGGNYLLRGPVAPTAATAMCFVARYSPQGVIEWGQQSNANASTPVVGSGIGLDAAGTVYVAGSCTGSVNFDPITTTLPGTNIGTFLGRFAGASGAVQGVAAGFNYAPTVNSAAYPRLAVAATGDAYIMNSFTQSITVGTTTLTSQGSNDVLVAKFTPQGTVAWAQQFGGTGNETLGRGQVDAAGNLYVCGSFIGSAVFGSTTLTSAGDSDGFLVKYSPQGTVQWTQASGGTGADYWLSLALDAGGAPYLVGNFSNTAQFGTVSLTSTGGQDMVAAACTTQGQVRWAQQAGSPNSSEFAYCVAVDGSGNAYMLGDFIGNCTFGSFPLSSTSLISPTAFVARLGSAVLATKANHALALSFSPNPATNELHLTGLPTGGRVELLDALGRPVRTTVVAADATVQVRGLAPGLYTMRATDAQGLLHTGRVVVQ